MPNQDQSYCTIAHHKHLSLFRFNVVQPLLLASGLLGSLGDLTAGFVGLGHTLDDADSHGLISDKHGFFATK
jgi:hypothetical protein